MTPENAELVRGIFEAGGADSTEAVLPFVPADVVWHPPPDWIEDSDYRGHDGVREAMGVFADTFDEYRAELHEAWDAGDRVVALVWQSGVIKGSVRRPAGGERDASSPYTVAMTARPARGRPSRSSPSAAGRA